MVYYMGTYSGYSLQHHGIKGQKWGVRRYQNPDGSLTAAGKKRYDTKQARELVRIARKEYQKAAAPYANEGVLNRHTHPDVVKAYGKLERAKKNALLPKVREKKNARRLRYEEEYRKKGMSEEDAEIAAYKRQRTQKIIAITAGVAITAAAAYVAYNHYDRNVDKFLKEGTIYKRVARTPDTAVHDAFYAAAGKNDPIKYKGFWGSTIKARGQDVYDKDIRIGKGGIKVASEKTARDYLKQELSRPYSREAFQKGFDKAYKAHMRLPDGDKQKELYKRAKKALDRGEVNKDVYRAFNVSLPYFDNERFGFKDGFYRGLWSKGYGAIEDMNDKYYSGYNAKTAKIFIDKGKIAVTNVQKLNAAQLANYKRQAIDIQAKEAFMVNNIDDAKEWLSVLAPVMPAATILSASSAYSNKKQSQASKSKETQVIRDYRKDHPNSKLSDDDILRNYYG